MTTSSDYQTNRPLLPAEIEDILKDSHYPVDFVTEGWVKFNNEWFECGASPSVRLLNPDPERMYTPDTYVTMHKVADKLNALEAEIERLKSRAS